MDTCEYYFLKEDPRRREVWDRISWLRAVGMGNHMAKFIPNEKNSCLLGKDNYEVRLECVNYCVAGLMSRCSAGTVWNDQGKCKFAEKSTVSNRCMHYIEAIGGHCDCEKAQRELRCTGPANADTL